MEWYQQDHQQALNKLQSAETGLSSQEARNRLAQYGTNKLAEEDRISRLQILLHQFKSPLIYILLIAAIVTLLLKEYIDSGVILAVVLVVEIDKWLRRRFSR